MKPPARLFLVAVAVLAFVPSLQAQIRNPIPQAPFEIRQDRATYNFRAVPPGGVPTSSTAGNPAGSNGRAPTPEQQRQDGLTELPPEDGQWTGNVPFGALAAPRARNLNTGLSYAANAGAANLDLPRGERDGQIVVVMTAARVGAPWLSRRISFDFGSEIPVPLVDVNGDTLPPGERPQDYWAPEPFRPTRLAAHDIVNLSALAAKLQNPTNAIAQFVANQLSATTRTLLPTPGNSLLTNLVNDLTVLVIGPSIYSLERYSNIVLSLETQNVDPAGSSDPRPARLNRLLLEDAFPTELARTAVNYYWSPHARTAYAIQPGPLTVVWKKAVPSPTKPDDYDANPSRYSFETGNYYTLFEARYVVSGSAVQPPRRMYWTEGEFSVTGKPITVPPGRVAIVNVVNNNNFPRRVEKAYRALGQTPVVEDPSQQLEETRTLWYESSRREILAFNLEGRVFVELLGEVEAGGRTRRPLGFEIVDVVREPQPADFSTELGERLTAYPLADNRDDSPLFPDLVAGSQDFTLKQFVAGSDRPIIHAIRETRNRNDVQLHWLESGLEGLRWPFRFVRYRLEWPADVAKYSHFIRPLVATEDEAKATAVQLPAENAPILDYQDPLDQPRAKLTETFAFYTWLSEQYPAHRSLLRFRAGEEIRFERVFSWLDQALRHPNLELPSFVTDFSTAPSGGMAHGSARVTGGALYLTDAANSQTGSYILSDFVGGRAVSNFVATFSVSLRDGSSTPADGFSFNFGTLPDSPLDEEGTANGLVVSFDLWDNGPDDSAPAISVKRNGVTIAAVAMGESRNPNPEPPGTLPVPFDPATGQPMTLTTGPQFVPVQIVLRPDGTMDVSYKSVLVLAHVATGYSPQTGRFGFGARTGGFNSTHWIDDLAIVVNADTAAGLPSLADSKVATSLNAWVAGRTFSWPGLSQRPRVEHRDVHVGQRILAPGGEIGALPGEDYLAGFIRQTEGNAFHPTAYRDPFADGFDTANRGAIIPVNAAPGNDLLEVWWFRRNGLVAEDLARGFKSILWPAVIGRYAIAWPPNPRQIVLASNDGSGPLVSLEAKGRIYVQNDRRLPGFNPNEEHALMEGGQAYALRDDLNILAGDDYTSEPFVLLGYTEADGRPAMRVFQVLRERPETGDVFNYTVEAGAILQPPMPLPLLGFPFAPKIIGTPPRSLNQEIRSWQVGTTTVRNESGVRWVALSTTHPHGIGKLRTLHLQNPTNSTGAQRFFVTAVDYTAQTLEGVVLKRDSKALSHWTGEQPDAFARRRFGVSDLTGVGEGDFVLAADPLARAFWPVEIMRTGTAEGLAFVDLQFSGTETFEAGQASTLLVLPESLSANGRFNNWRLGFELRPDQVADPSLREVYAGFTLQDRKGNIWVYRGPHDADDHPTMAMQYYYKTLPDFYFPTLPFSDQPPAGTITPYLRSKNDDGTYAGDPVYGNRLSPQTGDENPLLIHYSPVWPANAPVLQMAETLTLPKRGLPAMRGQTSVEIVYQQSQIAGGDTAVSAVLHDPTREKEYFLGPPNGASLLGKIPDSVRTQSYRGRTYFPNLPPHLVERFFLDPNRGEFGALVFRGQFFDEALGDDFLLLNVLGARDLLYLKDVCLPDDPARSRWDNAIDRLSTDLWLFVENPAKPGTYYPRDAIPYGPGDLSRVFDDDQAVDSYALTAVGPGSGYITLISGNGLAATPAAEPVSVHVLRVADTLYRGELKIVASSNPLSESITLQQVVDLAGRAEEYNFEWKIAAPVDGKPPAVYLTERVPVLLDGPWRHLRFPLATDRVAAVESAAADRVLVDVTTSVAPVNRVAFLPPAQSLDERIRFSLLPSTGPRPIPGTALVLRDSDGREFFATVHGLSSGNDLVVELDPGQSEAPTVSALTEVYERAVNGRPHSIVFRDFTIPANAAYTELWLSLDLDPALGARVHLDGQPIVIANLGDEDTPRSTPPSEFFPLSRAYLLDRSALAGGQVQGNGSVRHVVAVELFAAALPDERLAFNLRLEASQSVDVTEDTGWKPLDEQEFPDGVRATLGGRADVKVLSDNYLIMRYQAKRPDHASFRPDPSDGSINTAWSSWTRPQLAEGWIKRVLAGINPFNQRITDLFNNQANTDVSILQQAGPRWEGDIALNLDALNDFGLIEIYETVLRRGRKLSIDAGINYGPANDALLLAAGYINDLYMMLGNEGWADAANPTIGIGTKDHTYGDIATALFAFRGQLPTLLEEELALLRGRDDFLLPGVEIRPVYNRLIWNYTRGIDAGEVIYALNYNVLDLDDNGRVDADDARRLYPQGHGDAYGHYLTALKGYYGLLMDTDFDWVPRIEAVTVLGQPVSVDYQDERKFAAAAAAVARAGKQVVDLTWRRDYQPGEGIGWDHLAPEAPNNERAPLSSTRQWGVDHWATRTGQGAYLNWVVGNAILPDRDPDPSHEGGIQQVDRRTVVELLELPALASSLQTSLDNAEAGMNPLGLPPTSVPFDINPTLVVGGENQTHFEQVYGRARTALQNALAAFDDAKDVTRLMRSEEDALADLRTTVRRQELAYTNQLIELYGTPYPDDIGPGKTYRTGYGGPDLVHYMYVDTPELSTSLLDPTSESTWRIDTQTFVANWVDASSGISDFNWITKARVNGIDLGTNPNPWASNYTTNHYVEYTLAPHGFFQKPAAWKSRRSSPGRTQQAISDIIKARNAAYLALYQIDAAKGDLDWAIKELERKKDSHQKIRDWQAGMLGAEQTLEAVKTAVEIVDKILDVTGEQINIVANSASESLPTTFIAGLASGGDLTAPARAALKAAGVTFKSTVEWKKVGTFAAIKALEVANATTKRWIEFDQIQREEWDQTLRDATSSLRDKVYGVQNRLSTLNSRLQELDDAKRSYQALLAEGDRIQEERQIFRQRAAAIIQGFRTRDAAFRSFRNEKLERYKTLFDLAAQYSFMAAQAFDYETGLLHTDAGKRFVSRTVQARALGVMTGGVPQFAGSNTGDPGLSSVLAEMQADWLVLKGRLGFNNPDAYGTTVSLRTENLRLLPGTDGDQAWKDALVRGRMAHLLDDPDIQRHCLQIDPGDGLASPGIVLEFGTTIASGLNLFGRPLAGSDHAFSPSSFATKIHAVGVALEGYRGMDNPVANSGAVGFSGATSPSDPSVPFLDPNALAANPYVYLIPVGVDSMRSPPLGDSSVVRTWSVDDVAIPLPFNIGASGFSNFPFWQSSSSLSEPLFAVRKHQAFRPVSSANLFPTDLFGVGGQLQQSQYTNRRLIGRSAWNSRWKLVIPGRTLLHDPNEGLDRFIQTVRDVKLRFVTYSYAGN